MLSVDDAVPFLLDRGLVTRGDIIRGDLEVVDISRRNRNLRVVRRHATGYLLKQPDPDAPSACGTLMAEALFYRFCQEEPRAEAVRAFLPRLVDFVDDRSLPVLELLDGAQPLQRHYASLGAGEFPADIGALLGRSLATFHRVFQDPGLREDERLRVFPHEQPWVLNVHKPVPEMLMQLSGANWQMLGILQQTEIIGRCLEELRRDWRVETLIHSDLKADNLLLVTEDDSERLYIVDWELVQHGDPAWDVGSLLHDMLVFWVQSMPLSARASPAEMMAEAQFPLSKIVPAFRALWSTYRRETGLAGRESAIFLSRAVRSSAARMVQSVYETCNQAAALSNHVVMMLHVIANIFADPAAAALSVFGIAPTWILPHASRS